MDNKKKICYNTINDSRKVVPNVNESSCLFAQSRNTSAGLIILNFVYERTAQFKPQMIVYACWSLNIVTSGRGILHTPGGDYPLAKGNVFMLFAAKPYYIENVENLNYIYISYTGIRAAGLAERMALSPNSPITHGFADLIPMWSQCFDQASKENVDLLCEGLLLYTASFLCSGATEAHGKFRGSEILKIKDYVDLHFTDSTLTLNSVSAQFQYSPKYVTTAFPKVAHSSFREYLCKLRMDYAKSLMDSGTTYIKDIAEKSGYSDSLYFSKVFSKKFGISPRAYIASVSRMRGNENRD